MSIVYAVYEKGAFIQCNQTSLIRTLESQWYVCPIKFLSISLAQWQKICHICVSEHLFIILSVVV